MSSPDVKGPGVGPAWQKPSTDSKPAKDVTTTERKIGGRRISQKKEALPVQKPDAPRPPDVSKVQEKTTYADQFHKLEEDILIAPHGLRLKPDQAAIVIETIKAKLKSNIAQKTKQDVGSLTGLMSQKLSEKEIRENIKEAVKSLPALSQYTKISEKLDKHWPEKEHTDKRASGKAQEVLKPQSKAFPPVPRAKGERDALPRGPLTPETTRASREAPEPPKTATATPSSEGARRPTPPSRKPLPATPPELRARAASQEVKMSYSDLLKELMSNKKISEGDGARLFTALKEKIMPGGKTSTEVFSLSQMKADFKQAYSKMEGKNLQHFEDAIDALAKHKSAEAQAKKHPSQELESPRASQPTTQATRLSPTSSPVRRSSEPIEPKVTYMKVLNHLVDNGLLTDEQVNYFSLDLALDYNENDAYPLTDLISSLEKQLQASKVSNENVKEILSEVQKQFRPSQAAPAAPKTATATSAAVKPQPRHVPDTPLNLSMADTPKRLPLNMMQVLRHLQLQNLLSEVEHEILSDNLTQHHYGDDFIAPLTQALNANRIEAKRKSIIIKEAQTFIKSQQAAERKISAGSPKAAAAPAAKESAPVKKEEEITIDEFLKILDKNKIELKGVNRKSLPNILQIAHSAKNTYSINDYKKTLELLLKDRKVPETDIDSIMDKIKVPAKTSTQWKAPVRPEPQGNIKSEELLRRMNIRALTDFDAQVYFDFIDEIPNLFQQHNEVPLKDVVKFVQSYLEKNEIPKAIISAVLSEIKKQ